MVHNAQMRRALSIFLVLLSGLGPLALVLNATDDNANLPACCRRHGEHRCAMSNGPDAADQSRAPSFTAPSRCPLYPRSGSAAPAPIFALTRNSFALDSPCRPAQLGFAQDSEVSSIQLRVLTLRGPPASLIG